MPQKSCSKKSGRISPVESSSQHHLHRSSQNRPTHVDMAIDALVNDADATKLQQVKEVMQALVKRQNEIADTIGGLVLEAQSQEVISSCSSNGGPNSLGHAAKLAKALTLDIPSLLKEQRKISKLFAKIVNRMALETEKYQKESLELQEQLQEAEKRVEEHAQVSSALRQSQLECEEEILELQRQIQKLLVLTQQRDCAVSESHETVLSMEKRLDMLGETLMQSLLDERREHMHTQANLKHQIDSLTMDNDYMEQQLQLKTLEAKQAHERCRLLEERLQQRELYARSRGSSRSHATKGAISKCGSDRTKSTASLSVDEHEDDLSECDDSCVTPMMSSIGGEGFVGF